MLSSVIERREFRTLVSALEHHQYIKPIQVPGLKALERVLEKGEDGVCHLSQGRWVLGQGRQCVSLVGGAGEGSICYLWVVRAD